MKHLKTLVVIIFAAAMVLSVFSVTTTNHVIYELDRTGQTIEVTPYAYPTQKALYKGLTELGHDVSDNIAGFAVWSPNDLKCDIYYVAPKYVDREPMATIGHEMSHCIYGSFHK